MSASFWMSPAWESLGNGKYRVEGETPEGGFWANVRVSYSDRISYWWAEVLDTNAPVAWKDEIEEEAVHVICG